MATLALNNALSGLKVAQQSLNVLSQNIANVNNPDYTRQTLSQVAVNIGNAVGAGVDIASIDRQMSQYITNSVVSSSSNVASATALNDYYNQLQVYIGQPGKSNSIDTFVNSFFNSMSQLSVSPETASLKTIALAAGQTLATQVSSLAGNVEQLRYQADTEIKQSVDTVNAQLQNIKNLNTAILSAKANNQSVNALQDSIDASVKTIANLMGVTYRIEQDGTASVTTTAGVQLLGNGNISQLDYKPATSADDFKNGIPSGGINLYQLGPNGQRIGSAIPLVSPGIGDQVTSNITTGKIAGLLQVRDKTMPDVMAQLDNLASSIVNSVNAIHNSGSGFPPVQTLTGTTMVDPKSSHEWSGTVMIAALDSNGKAVTSPYQSDTAMGDGLAPLTLDLGSLDSGNGAGKPTMQAIIDKINQYYGPPQPRASVGDIKNIQLVAKSDSLTAGSGTFDFSLNLSSLAAGNASVQITGASITGGATINTPSGSVTVAGGATVNTDGTLNFSANMAAAGPGPYTVTLNVQTTNADGSFTTGTVSYTLNTAANGLNGNTYAANAVTGSAVLEQPTTNQAILVAKLVDANGNEIAKDPVTGDYLSSGYLQIGGATSASRVAIDEMNSTELGNAAQQPSSGATNFGFSHYFGLNNFFVDTGKVTNSSLNMAVNAKLSNNPQLMGIGKLSLATQPTDTTHKRYTYEIGSGSAQIADAISTLGNATKNFPSAGSLAETNLTFSDYAAQILGDAASKTSASSDAVTQTTLINQGFADKDTSIRGVNIDEEMSNTILYQNAYSANARVITVTKQLFDDLLTAFQ